MRQTRWWTCASTSILLLALGGCASVSSPVLRHETGESLGQGKVRVFGRIEASRTAIPLVPAYSTGVAQSVSLYRTGSFGVQGDVGVISRLDLQFGASLTPQGAGWRAGTKFQFLNMGPLAAAAMLGYSVVSGSGTQTLETTDTPADVEHTLSTSAIDLSVPVSFKVGTLGIVYGGPMWIHTRLSGNFAGSVVTDASNDFGINLGVRVSHGIFVGDLEVAGLLTRDPFEESIRAVPYFGLSFGITR